MPQAGRIASEKNQTMERWIRMKGQSEDMKLKESQRTNLQSSKRRLRALVKIISKGMPSSMSYINPMTLAS